jgi:hypothetical protein
VSIIYEALRKTQRNREFRSMPTRERMAVRNLDWLDRGLVALILILLFIILWLYIPHMVRHHAPLPVANTAKMAVPQSVPAEEMAVEIKSGNLVLNGVLLSDNEKMALINNKTYHVGDNVEGRKVVSIEFDSVRLIDVNGRVQTLRTAS